MHIACARIRDLNASHFSPLLVQRTVMSMLQHSITYSICMHTCIHGADYSLGARRVLACTLACIRNTPAAHRDMYGRLAGLPAWNVYVHVVAWSYYNQYIIPCKEHFNNMVYRCNVSERNGHACMRALSRAIDIGCCSISGFLLAGDGDVLCMTDKIILASLAGEVYCF